MKLIFNRRRRVVKKGFIFQTLNYYLSTTMFWGLVVFLEATNGVTSNFQHTAFLKGGATGLCRHLQVIKNVYVRVFIPCTLLRGFYVENGFLFVRKKSAKSIKQQYASRRKASFWKLLGQFSKEGTFCKSIFCKD